MNSARTLGLLTSAFRILSIVSLSDTQKRVLIIRSFSICSERLEGRPPEELKHNSAQLGCNGAHIEVACTQGGGVHAFIVVLIT